ncbi:MAG TPA: oxygen-independent coproporphyrinogen III oxidase [Bradyrhizobium sp.]|nr:oxygen-independent coproporphyrinogen III oxidase [Bradyrhizobium sp.]
MKNDPKSKYRDERLPRYTSYPTAPHFSADVAASRYETWLASLDADATGSLYLHVPFCRSMCWYCGCHTTITKHDAPILDYLAVLRREIETVTEQIGRRLAVGHIHFGGGTPTIMRPNDFTGLMDLLAERFAVRPGAEIAIEIDPRTLTPAMTSALGRGGVTRASLGVQSFDGVVQQAINRVQTVTQTASAVSALRAAGVSGINFDLIYGLPHQTIQSCIDTVAACLDMAPDRFAVFGYAHVPGFKKHQRMIDENALPDGESRFAQAEAIGTALLAAGYQRIGLDHYARPADPIVDAQRQRRLRRNFQGYTTDTAEALIGFGASAIGRLPQGYVQNAVGLGDYAARISAGKLGTAKGYVLTADDRLRADLIERVMCDFAVDVGAVARRHQVDPSALFATLPRLATLQADGIVERCEDEIRVATGARHLVRTAASAFDAYLDAPARTFSRAV